MQPVCNRISEKRNSKTHPIFKPYAVDYYTYKKYYSQLSICDTNSGHSPAEFNGTRDPSGIPAPVEPAENTPASGIVVVFYLQLLRSAG
jgi:hypothetical protein